MYRGRRAGRSPLRLDGPPLAYGCSDRAVAEVPISPDIPTVACV